MDADATGIRPRPTGPTIAESDYAADALRLLTGLGGTPDEIALALIADGITGQADSATGCVIAKYLRKQGVPVRGIHLGTETYGEVVFGALDSDGMNLLRCPLPAAVNEFAQRFDQDEWPELVDAEATP